MSEALATEWMIRPPRVNDAEAIATMQANSWRRTYERLGDEIRNQLVRRDAEAFLHPDRIDARRTLIREIESSSREFQRIITDSDDRGIVGGFLYGRRDDEAQELQALYVIEGLHGTGWSQSLMEEFLAWCDPTRPVELGVVDDNLRAQRFYAKLGFQAILRAPSQFNEYLHQITMVRPAERGESI